MNKKILIGMLMCSTALVCARGEVPRGWFADDNDYNYGVDKTVVKDGKPSAQIATTNILKEGTSMCQVFSAEKYKGKRVKLSGYLKTEGAEASAGLWLRVDGKNTNGLAYACLPGGYASLRGDTDWQDVRLVIDVPSEAAEIYFGVVFSGVGKVWINGFKFEIVSKDEPLTCHNNASWTNPEPENLDFTK